MLSFVYKKGEEIQVKNYTKGDDQYYPSVSSISNDSFVITWSSNGQDGSGYGVFAQLFSNNGNKIGYDFQVNSYSNNDQKFPSVSSLSNDNFVITWSSNGQDGSGYGVFAQIFSNNGNKIGQEFKVNTYTNYSQTNPSISSLSNDSFVVTWMSQGQNDFSDDIFAQIFSNHGNKIGYEFQVNNYTNFSQFNPSVSSLFNDRFVITWSSQVQDNSSHGVYAQIFSNNGNKIGKEFQVNSFTKREQTRPSVSYLSNEKFVITWTSAWQDNSANGVFAQIFSNNGNKIGQEFQVHTYTYGSQEYPSVSSLSNHSFVITWSGCCQGYTNGVFAQIFYNNESNILSNSSNNSSKSSNNSSNFNISNSSNTSSKSFNTSSNSSNNSSNFNLSNSSNTSTNSNSANISSNFINSLNSANYSKKNSSNILIIIVSVLGTLFVIGLIIFFVFFKKYQAIKKEKIIFSNEEINTNQKIIIPIPQNKNLSPIFSNEIELNEINPIDNFQINNNNLQNNLLITPDNDNNKNQINEIEKIKIMTMKTPEEFLCPITLGIFVNPILVHPSGFTYENSIISNQNKDPQTREEITQKTPNRGLKNAIVNWMKNLTVLEIELNNEIYRNVEEWINCVGKENIKNDSELKSILKCFEEAALNK